MTIFDMVFFVGLLLSTLMGFFRGFLREFMGLLSWVLAYGLTMVFLKDAKKLLCPWLPENFAALAGPALIFFVLLVFFMILTKYLSGGPKGTFSPLNTALGVVFGALRGIFFALLCYGLLFQYIPFKEYPQNFLSSLHGPFMVNLMEKTESKWISFQNYIFFDMSEHKRTLYEKNKNFYRKAYSENKFSIEFSKNHGKKEENSINNNKS